MDPCRHPARAHSTIALATPWRGLAIAAMLAACGSVERRPADDGGDSADDGGDSGDDGSDAPDDGSDGDVVTDCEPSTTVCDDDSDELTVCDAAGQGVRTSCPLECKADEERCNEVDPSNGLAPYVDMAGEAPAAELPDGTSIDTTDGVVTGPDGPIDVPTALVEQVGAPRIRVFMFGDLVLDDVTITGAHAAALVASGTITVQGHVVAAGRGAVAGPGVDSCTLATGLGADGLNQGSNAWYPGGGGGGFAGTGAPAGGCYVIEPAAGGASAGEEEPIAGLSPLRGGCTGGGTDMPDGNGITQVGGGGGGALQLVSRVRIEVVTGDAGTGLIDLGGGGGPAGPSNPTGYTGGGGGGGSGGSLLLEAPDVEVVGAAVTIAAGGGGGGGGCNSVGQDGSTTDTPSAGGSCPPGVMLTAGGSGGLARVGTTPIEPTAGVSTTTDNVTPLASGGGGGSYGRVRINTRTGEFEVGSGAVIFAVTSIGTLRIR